ncbi:hypothetical protein BMI90_11535 [Thioclava sp. L04-15]|nr:hypothetical protein BMI90_11535 [Thioclava sp. L04-15]
MTVPEIVLLGYYGRGNFGDDILMLVAHEVARSMMPGASVGIRLPHGAAYPTRLLKNDFLPVPFGTRDHHRLILHGGGGTFFDFTSYSVLKRFRNAALLASGAGAYVGAEAALRRLIGKPRISAERRIGLGIGVGTFSSGSRKLLEALPVLSSFDRLWVRDHKSCDNLRSLSVSPPTVVGSDLAFISDAWCPSNLAMRSRRPEHRRPKLGVILRDWPVDITSSFAEEFQPIIAGLAKEYDLTIISLDPAADRGVLNTFIGFPQLLWRPSSMKLHDFLHRLSGFDAFLTSRAHGAICGACLGRPSVILEIEPKLAAVNRMLPRATRLAVSKSNLSTISLLVEEVLSISADSIEADVKHNRMLSEAALDETIKDFRL